MVQGMRGIWIGCLVLAACGHHDERAAIVTFLDEPTCPGDSDNRYTHPLMAQLGPDTAVTMYMAAGLGKGDDQHVVVREGTASIDVKLGVCAETTSPTVQGVRCDPAHVTWYATEHVPLTDGKGSMRVPMPAAGVACWTGQATAGTGSASP